MILKSTSIATKLLLMSCVSAVVVIVAILGFIKLSIIPQMTDKALANQTSALAHSLKSIRSAPEQWTYEALAKDTAPDAFSIDGKSVATLFVLRNGQFTRMATTLKKEDGSRAIGTILDPRSAAAEALHQGQAYSGPITLFHRPHMATYLPVSFSNGLRGAVFIGIDYQSADPMLALAKQMDYVVLAVGAIGVVLLAIGLLFSIRVERAHRETEDIMRTTQDGLFLLDHQLRMGSQTSGALSGILGFTVKPGDHFLELLKPSVSPKTFETAQEYIDLLLRHDVKEKLVASLNPLDCIEINAMQTNGRMETRFLQIRFNRVKKAEKITHLLVTANDITRQVKLERELRESEKRVQDQMTMMVHILQADPRSLQEFIDTGNTNLNHINEYLRTSNPKTGISTPQLDAIMRLAHQLKGDASAMQLEAITQSLHGLETQVQDLRAKADRSSEDLLPVAVLVKTLYSDIASIQDVIARINQVRTLVTVEPPKPQRNTNPEEQPALARQWMHFAHQLAEKREKKVELSYLGLDPDTLAQPLRETLNTLVNQFIRNSLVHGVENPAERKERGKSEAAHLSVYISDQGDGTVELSFRDDGRGINPEKIREAAVRSGKLSVEAAQAMDVRKLTMMIFEPGISTQESVDEDAGRGVGLDSVKEMIAQMGGRIRIGTTRGEYCHFRVVLPLTKTGKETSPPHHETKEAI